MCERYESGPLILRYVSMEDCERGCCTGLTLVVESNVGIEYSIEATLGDNQRIVEQESEVLN